MAREPTLSGDGGGIAPVTDAESVQSYLAGRSTSASDIQAKTA